MDEARRLLSRAVQLQPGYFGDVIVVYLFDLKRPDLARELAGDDFARLQALLAACAESKTFDKFAEVLEAECEAVLRRRVKLDDATSSELAALADIDLERREFATAIELYRRALAKEYRQLDWHINLARALAETGRIEDGITELRICLRLRQDHPAAKRLLEELLVKLDNSPR